MSDVRFINPQKFLEKLKSSARPPKGYDERKELIKAETRVLELRCSLENREATPEEIDKIVQMKLDLDGYLGAWIEDVL